MDLVQRQEVQRQHVSAAWLVAIALTIALALVLGVAVLRSSDAPVTRPVDLGETIYDEVVEGGKAAFVPPLGETIYDEVVEGGKQAFAPPSAPISDGISQGGTRHGDLPARVAPAPVGESSDTATARSDLRFCNGAC